MFAALAAHLSPLLFLFLLSAVLPLSFAAAYLPACMHGGEEEEKEERERLGCTVLHEMAAKAGREVTCVRRVVRGEARGVAWSVVVHVVQAEPPCSSTQSMVLMHGANTSGVPTFGPFAVHNASRFGRVYVLDMPGFGESRIDARILDRSKNEAIAILGEVMWAVVDALCPPPSAPPLLCAHSFGCIVLTEMLAHRAAPSIMICPAGMLPTGGRWSAWHALALKLGLPMAGMRTAARLSPTVTAFLLRRITSPYWRLYLRDLSAPDGIGDAFVAKVIDARFTYMRCNHPNLPRLLHLPSLPPLTFVFGEQDELIPPHIGRFSCAVLRQAFGREACNLFVVGGEGHLVHAAPEKLDEAVSSALTSASTSASPLPCIPLPLAFSAHLPHSDFNPKAAARCIRKGYVNALRAVGSPVASEVNDSWSI